MELLSICVMLLCYDRHWNSHELWYPVNTTSDIYSELIIEQKEYMYDLLHDIEYERYRVHEDRESYYYNWANKKDWMHCYKEKLPMF